MFRTARATHWNVGGPEQRQPEQRKLMFQFYVQFHRNSLAVIS